MLNSLQILRAIAAYAVVMFHFSVAARYVTSSAVPDLYILTRGVDLFFVISGFVMVHATRDAETPAEFMAKRVARIVPLYWAATLLTCVVAIPIRYAYANADFSLGGVLASLAFVPHPALDGKLIPVIEAGWTLNFEMMFYLLFALSLHLPRKFTVWGVLTLITLVWGAARLSGDPVLGRFYGDPVIFEFAAGCLVAKLVALRPVAAWIGRTPMWPLMVLGGVLFLLSNLYLPVDRFTQNVLPMSLLVFAAAGQDLYRQPPAKSLLTRLGDASYSAYLLHTLIGPVCAAVAMKLFGLGDAAALAAFGFGVVATMVISDLSLKFFERPAGRMVRGLLRPKAKPAAQRAYVDSPSK